MARIYKNKETIDTKKVNAFFEKRFLPLNPLASVMVRGSENDGIAEERNKREGRLLRSFIGQDVKISVFDIGCGMGRWVENLKGNIKQYVGIDFVDSYVKYAQNLYRELSFVNFHKMSATNINKTCLTPPYNLIISTGLSMYLNDSALDLYVKEIPDFCSNGSLIYFRESISVLEHRLTLKDWPSEELKTDYNAIYRTQSEYEEYFCRYWRGFTLIKTDLLLTKELGVRQETNQRYWLFRKMDNKV